MKPLPVAAIALVAAVASAVAAIIFIAPFLTLGEVKENPAEQPVAASTEDLSADLRDQLAKANARIAELEAAASASPTEPPAPEPAPEPEPEQPAKKKPTLDEIRESLAKNSAARVQFQALTELIYADLLNSLDLDPETKAALRELLLDAQIEELALAQYAISQGDIPWNQVAQWQDEERAILDEQIRALLAADEFKTWQEFAATYDERALEGSLRNQIRAFASGLSDENFEAVMQVAIEEFLAEQNTLNNSNTPFTQAENMRYQIRAMERMRERLREYLPADQFAEINNWLNMGINLFEQQLAAMDA